MDSFMDLFPDFDPNAPGEEGSFFGLPHSPDQAKFIIIPIPWDVTVSYHEGCSRAPLAIKEASLQVDLSLNGIKSPWAAGISAIDFPQDLLKENKQLRELVIKGGNQDAVNEGSEKLNQWVQERSSEILNQAKFPIALGGDHSTPLGLMQALAHSYEGYGILQVDAHADLREAYEGYTGSHASIMHNALKIPQVEKLVQVGIRDFCEEEEERIQNDDRVSTFFYEALMEERFEGKNWKDQCKDIVNQLPQNVYLSLDVDGLDPKLCPNTGTPVPGGLEYYELIYLVKAVVDSGRTIIGFDLSEVSPGEDNDWDANVGARLLYHIAAWAGVSWGWLDGV